MVPMARIERATSPLPRECSTTEPHGPSSTLVDTGLAADAPPTGLCGRHSHSSTLERETGIEPASSAWKAGVLPLNYSRPGNLLRDPRRGCRMPSINLGRGGGGWIRTSVGVSQQIYSLPPLTTRAPLHAEPAMLAHCEVAGATVLRSRPRLTAPTNRRGRRCERTGCLRA